jgi:hypothetical protein
MLYFVLNGPNCYPQSMPELAVIDNPAGPAVPALIARGRGSSGREVWSDVSFREQEAITLYPVTHLALLDEQSKHHL